MTTSSVSVSILFEQLKAGDPDARSLILTRMQERLRRLTASILRQFPRVQRQHELTDVVNDLNAKLLHAIDAGVHPQGSTEFLGLATHKLFQLLKTEADKLRRRDGLAGRYQDLNGKPLVGIAGDSVDPRFEPAQDTYNPELIIVWSEFWEQVDKLPEEERTVFMMHYVLSVSQKEIAEELAVEPKTVSKRWLKATTKLKPFLPKGNLSLV